MLMDPHLTSVKMLGEYLIIKTFPSVYAMIP